MPFPLHWASTLSFAMNPRRKPFGPPGSAPAPQPPAFVLRSAKFEEYRELLQPLMDFYTDRGRLPTVEEIGTEALGPLQSEFGSIKRAFNIILKANGCWGVGCDRRQTPQRPDGLPGPHPLRQTPQIQRPSPPQYRLTSKPFSAVTSKPVQPPT